MFLIHTYCVAELLEKAIFSYSSNLQCKILFCLIMVEEISSVTLVLLEILKCCRLKLSYLKLVYATMQCSL